MTFPGAACRPKAFAYDALNRVVSYFFYDQAGHTTGSYDSSGKVLDETMWLGDLPVAVLSVGQPAYIAPDHRGALAPRGFWPSSPELSRAMLECYGKPKP
jgi:hypothetical protein